MAELPEPHHHRHHIHLRTALSRARKRRRSEGPAPPLTLGERLSDLVAATVGSWRFILIQSGLLVAWLIANAAFGGNAWDPYPFILLNLMLSCMPRIFMQAITYPRIIDLEIIT